MYRSVFLLAALAVAAPAVAQNTTTPPSEPPAGESAAGGSPFGAHDADRNGSLSRTEFTAMMRARNPASPPAEADINAAFQRIDADSNGEISVAEARAAQGGQPQGSPSQ